MVVVGQSEIEKVMQLAQEEPGLWIEKVFSCRLWQKQYEIAKSVVGNGRTTVRSCEGSGKSYIAARVALWFLFNYSPSTVITTAPSFRQIEQILWREIAQAWGMKKLRLRGELTATRLDVEDGWFAIGISTDQPERFQGFHNKNVLVIGDEACYDDETEVLTREGWKLFKDVQGKDTLLTANPKTFKAHYRKPKAIVGYDYNGEMYEIKRKGVSFSLTPQHNCLASVNTGYREGKWQFQKISELTKRSSFYMKRDMKWVGSNRKTFTLPTLREESFHRATRNKRGQYLRCEKDIGDWAEFLGWYLSEGSLLRRNEKPVGVSISQKSLENQEEILVLAQKLGLRANSYGDEIHIYSPQVAKVLSGYGSNALNKFIPSYIKELPPQYIARFLRSYFLGDGYNHNGTKVFYTSSQNMADDLQELIIKGGNCGTVNKRAIKGQRKWIKDHYATSSVDGYVVVEYSKPTLIKIRTKDIKRVPYSGKVYCADLPPYHLLYVRRNGYCMWSGNSGLSEAVYQAIENPLSTGRTRLLLIGNPTQPVGKFKDTFGNPLYNQIHISAFDTPNFSSFGITLEDIKDGAWMGKSGISQADIVDGGWVKKMPFPNLIAPPRIAERYREWGENSFAFQVYVLGDFPLAGEQNLFAWSDIEAAVGRELVAEGDLVAGLDISRYGDSETVFVRKMGNKVLGIDAWSRQDITYTVGRVIRLCREYGSPRVIHIDATAIGQDDATLLSKEGINVDEVLVGQPAVDTERFANRRAELYWLLSKKFAEGSISIPNDRILMAQLADIRFSYTGKGKLIMESKEEMRARGSKSPDRADALMLSFIPVGKMGKPKWRQY